MMQTAIPKVALVTGAAKRLGRAIAEDLVEHGFSVALHANHSLEQAENLTVSLRDRGHRAVAVKADLTNVNETQSLIQTATAALGPIGLLVNNASIFEEDHADQFDAALFSRHFDVHVKAPAILAADFVRYLPEGQEGLIVNIIDQRVWALKPTFFSYTLSKATLWTATRTMAQAFAPRVRVNAIGPGPTLPSDRQTEEDFRTQLTTLPLQRGPELGEFGRTIRFLFDTPSITGQMIALDGGQHLIWPGSDGAEIVE